MRRSSVNTRFPVFTPDGALLVPDGPQVVEWDARSGLMVRMFSGPVERVMAVRLTADGKTVIALSSDKRLTGWDRATGQKRAEFDVPESRGSIALAVFPDGKQIAVDGPAGTVSVREWPSGKELHQLNMPAADDWVFSLSLSPDGAKLAATGTDGKVRVWDSKTWRVETTFPGIPGRHTHAVCAFSPDGRRLAVGSSTSLRIWVVDNWDSRPITTAAEAGGLVAFDSASATVVAAPVCPGNGSATFTRWDAKTGLPLGRLVFPLVQQWNHAALAPDGRRVVIDIEQRRAFVFAGLPVPPVRLPVEVAPAPHTPR